MAKGQGPQERMARGGVQQDWPGRLEQMRQQAKQSMAEGAVTPAYRANLEEIIALLNRALASEWAAMLQYEHHYTMASDIHSAGLREMWREHADEEREHARKINERLDQLGGVPANAPRQIEELTPTPFEAGHDLLNMLEIDLADERLSLQFYNEIVRLCGFDDNETRVLFEQILLDEAEHANEIANILYQQDATSGEQIPTLHEMVAKDGELKSRTRS